mmetsp:Transcript_8914/g.21750  ORF Transcript_8914/g.21750 Transcript_8914/m.21750 type:complete len:251 (-) Transcript_8914:1131-1883(-)
MHHQVVLTTHSVVLLLRHRRVRRARLHVLVLLCFMLLVQQHVLVAAARRRRVRRLGERKRILARHHRRRGETALLVTATQVPSRLPETPGGRHDILDHAVRVHALQHELGDLLRVGLCDRQLLSLRGRRSVEHGLQPSVVRHLREFERLAVQHKVQQLLWHLFPVELGEVSLDDVVGAGGHGGVEQAEIALLVRLFAVLHRRSSDEHLVLVVGPVQRRSVRPAVLRRARKDLCDVALFLEEHAEHFPVGF